MGYEKPNGRMKASAKEGSPMQSVRAPAEGGRMASKGHQQHRVVDLRDKRSGPDSWVCYLIYDLGNSI